MREVELDQIVLGTTIAPFDYEKQIEAVKSWIENGFYVISFNTSDEIEVIKPYFTEVPIEFVALEHNSKELSGKELPYIQDVLDIVASKTQKVCGYVNSDIFISPMPQGMDDFIKRESEGSIIFIHRNEINKYEDIINVNWDIHFDGIDAFFIDKRFANIFDSDNFYAQSVWDLCILIKSKILGIKIKELVNPIAFHIRHSVRWNFEKANALVEPFMKKYFSIENLAFKQVLAMYYSILYNDSQQICFCNSTEYKCLFVLDKTNDENIKYIEAQEYPYKEIQYSDDNKEDFDIVFYIKNRLKLSKVFCKAVIYIMTQFKCDLLSIGRFFISSNEGKYYFNELNRNIHVIKRINSECSLLSHVIKRTETGRQAEVYSHLSYEFLNIDNSNIVKKINLVGKAYLMPAGVRANEWFNSYYKSTNIEIVGFIDNNVDKIGKTVSGKTIYPLEVLNEDDETAIVIIVSKYYSFEIEQQLLKIMDGTRILNSSYILAIGEDGIYYFDINKYKNLC